MPFLALILPALKSVGDGLWAFSSSPLGRLIIVGGGCFLWGDYRQHEACERRIAAAAVAQERADSLERARQAKATDLIQLSDRSREAAIAAKAAAEKSTITALESAAHVEPKAFSGKDPPVFECDLRSNLDAGLRKLATTKRGRTPKPPGAR